jgi:hypothetical protein
MTTLFEPDPPSVQRAKLVAQKDKTIKRLVELCDELRQPFNNSIRHDLYLKACQVLNEMEENGEI